jgi:hypothetical protein
MICLWEAFGKSRNHDQLVEMLLDDAHVQEFHF